MANDNQITPGRVTTAYFDLTETTLIEPAFSVTRAGAEIAKDVALGLANDTPADDTARHGDVIHWATGAITLKPLQHDISNISESTVSLPFIVSLPAKMRLLTLLTATAYIAIQNGYRDNSDLPGFAASATVPATGDPFLIKEVPAGGSWSASLVDAQPTPPFVTQDIPMDRIGVSNDTYPVNQGWFLRWKVPGTDAQAAHYTWAFYFGQYGVCYKGSGIAELWEYTRRVPLTDTTGVGSMHWVRRARWQYARKGQLSNTAHSMGIYPHTDPHGVRYISFTNNQLEAASVASQFARTGAAQVAPGEYVYFVDAPGRPKTDKDGSPGAVTKAGVFRTDIHRYLKVEVQVSTLGWPTSGFLIDLPADVPLGSSSAVPVNVYTNAQVPPTCSLNTTLQDANTGGAYTPGTSDGPQVRFDFTGDGSTTPILWEYRLVRAPVTTTIAPGIFHAKPSQVSVTGVSGDPAQDTAHVTVQDVKAGLPRLRSRGRFSFSLVSEDAAGKVVLHRGYAMRPTGVRRGKAGRVYPAADWQDFSVPCAGMGQRLSEQYQGPVQRKYQGDPFAPDPSVPGSNAYLPWKVTDNVRDALLNCGYPPAMVAIPDVGIRLWQGETVKKDDYILDAAGNTSEYILRLVRDYLGAYLIFDANYGSADANGLPLGAWTLLFQTPLPPSGQFASPLYNFVTTAASPVTSPHILSAYPALTAPIFGKIDFQTIPPEFNSVLVTTSIAAAGVSAQGAVQARCYNYNSFQAPGATNTLDPTHPDYLGYERRVIYPDGTLLGKNVEETQKACNWVARRFLDFACHAQRLAHFTVPLVFVTDPAYGHRRPLRFQDPITINGDASWLVKACHPKYAKDGFQLAEIEAIQPIAGQLVQPGIEALTFHRAALTRHAQQNTGSGTQSQRFGRSAVPAHREQAMLELPVFLGSRSALQDSTGAFYAMADYGPADSGVAL
jgi:hypothetical protein